MVKIWKNTFWNFYSSCQQTGNFPALYGLLLTLLLENLTCKQEVAGSSFVQGTIFMNPTSTWLFANSRGLNKSSPLSHQLNILMIILKWPSFLQLLTDQTDNGVLISALVLPINQATIRYMTNTNELNSIDAIWKFTSKYVYIIIWNVNLWIVFLQLSVSCF